jgi:o-succinylbenzoate synthase
MGRYDFQFERIDLKFKKPAGTSRGMLFSKSSFIIHIKDRETKAEGRGECSIIPGLNPETDEQVAEALANIQKHIETTDSLSLSLEYLNYPSVRFGMETALLTLSNPGNDILFQNPFAKGDEGIPINGLIWMEEPEDMWRQMIQKAEAGYRCIKMKVGALNFKAELSLLEKFRIEFGNDIHLRLDANGAFTAEDAFRKLERLSKYSIHSIEQPVKAGQWNLMRELCAYTPVPIALDEELIGIKSVDEKIRLLENIKPHYIILKPSLIGGLEQGDEWISLVEEQAIGWWATSALESNIGLNAIAQWTAEYPVRLPQGLGTGSLYHNNIAMPLEIRRDELWRSA